MKHIYSHVYPPNEPTCLLCGAFGPVEDADPCVARAARFAQLPEPLRKRLWRYLDTLAAQYESARRIPGRDFAKAARALADDIREPGWHNDPDETDRAYLPYQED